MSFRSTVALFVFLLAAPAAAQDTALAHPLTLGDAARIAARRSAASEAARFETRQAEARITQQRADILPTVSALGEESGRSINTATFGIDFPAPPGQPPLFDPAGQVVGPVNLFDARARASLTLLDFGALGRIRSARTTAEASAASAANVAEQSAQTAAAAYLRAQRARGFLSARIADSALADSLLVIARNQLRAGVGVALDVTRAESQLATVRAQLIAARNDRDRTRLDLLRSLNVSLDTPILLADSLADLPVADTLPNERDAVQRALHRRPDLRAASEQLAAARQQLGAIRAERLPSLSAFGDDGWIGKNSGRLLNTYDWGVQVSIPIFDGLRREGRVQEAEARARQLDVLRRDLEQSVATEVREALLDVASAREQVDAARERVRLARQELVQAQERFRAGVAGNADVITASLDLNSARTNLVDALTNYQTARVQLARSTGSVTELP